ncbi:MAG: choline dehydrogenase [Chloroflexota bacterium]
MNYDYIIVGAGSAGCVVANRLSAQSGNRVLLLEAGGPDKKQEIHIPAAFNKLFKSEVDWNYETVPQDKSNGRKYYWPRGKMLGGSSSINAMIYQRGNPANYDGWARLGNEEWSWEDVLPYFKKAENQERGGSEMHGVGGPLNVADLRDPNPMSTAFVEAAVQAGYLANDDFNDGEQEGFGQYQVTQKNGVRNSTAVGYLKPVLSRPNLTAETNAQVVRLVIENKRCTGVEYIHNGAAKIAYASKEVILSGGAINSPQLLLLSGIGPAEHLKEVGVQVKIDLPGVGQNLHDHLATMVTYYATQNISLKSAEGLGQVARYLLFKRGMLTSNVGESGGFVKLNPESEAPELQFHFAPAFFIRHGFESPDAHGFSIGPTLVKVKSRGHITLASTDPMAHPLIQPNYFEHSDDVQILVEGIKIAREIVGQAAFDPYRGEEYTPGKDVKTDDELADFVMDGGSQTLYHPVGTCKMGVDPLAVVSPELKVHGIDRLRVADASIMPEIVNANTNAPAIMIGEKCADMILNTTYAEPVMLEDA